MSPSSESTTTAISIPWPRVLAWESLFFTNYLFRFVSLEIWRASKTTSAVFEEMKFGETPLFTIRKILQHLPPLGPDSTIFDLGCGRGRAAFLFHFLSRAKVVALDVVASFIHSARGMAKLLGCADDLYFYCEDFRQAELEQADVIYACALCFGAETRKILLEKVLQGRPGCYLVTVGWRPEHARLQPLAHFSASFSWGSSGVSITQLKDGAL